MKRYNPAPKTRRRSKPKRPSCTVRGCTRRPYIGGEYCITHAKALADRLWSVYIRNRDGMCQAAAFFPNIRCAGSLQAMHLVSRRYLATRYDPSNGRAGCAAHHCYLTEHPLEADLFNRQVLGTAVYDELKARAMIGGRPDYASLIALYREDAA